MEAWLGRTTHSQCLELKITQTGVSPTCPCLPFLFSVSTSPLKSLWASASRVFRNHIFSPVFLLPSPASHSFFSPPQPPLSATHTHSCPQHSSSCLQSSHLCPHNSTLVPNTITSVHSTPTCVPNTFPWPLPVQLQPLVSWSDHPPRQLGPNACLTWALEGCQHGLGCMSETPPDRCCICWRWDLVHRCQLLN